MDNKQNPSEDSESIAEFKNRTILEIDLLKKEIALLEKDAQAKEKYRPQEIRKQLYAMVSLWGSWLTVIVGILGFIGIQQYVNNIVQKTVELNYAEQAKKQSAFNIRFEIKEIEDDIHRKNDDYEQALEKIARIKNDALNTKDEYLIQRYVDVYTRFAFSALKYELLDEISTEFEKEGYKFSYITWANIAIANFYLYAESKKDVSKQKSFEACKRALDIKPNYGEIPAIELLNNMITYDLNLSKESRDSALENSAKTFKALNSGILSTQYMAYTRLTSQDSVVSYYTNILKTNFPQEFKYLEDRYYDYMYSKTK